ncbi:MAG: glycosyltransferase [Bacteroidaceae bacterium]
MFSIIVCSISEKRLAALHQNITQTIGVPFEFITHDNRKDSYSIAKIYNECAAKSIYPYLLFVHEDVEFKTSDWGSILAEKLKEETCGVIGFAGSNIKSHSYSGWPQPLKGSKIAHVWQHRKEKSAFFWHENISAPFTPCITVDGLALFLQRRIWKENPFDEKLLHEFHCYDIDLSLSVAQKYKNYICGCIEVEHFSLGNFSRSWYAEVVRMHRKKWRTFLPLSVGTYSKDEIKKNEEHAFYSFLRGILKSDPHSELLPSLLHEFKKFPNTKKHLSHWLVVIKEYIRAQFSK